MQQSLLVLFGLKFQDHRGFAIQLVSANDFVIEILGIFSGEKISTRMELKPPPKRNGPVSCWPLGAGRPSIVWMSRHSVKGWYFPSEFLSLFCVPLKVESMSVLWTVFPAINSRDVIFSSQIKSGRELSNSCTCCWMRGRTWSSLGTGCARPAQHNARCSNPRQASDLGLIALLTA